MRRQVNAIQRAMRLMAFKVDGTGTAALGGPDEHQATLTDNGVGDYTITYAEPFSQIPIVSATPITTGIMCRVKASTILAVTIECLDLDTPAATDCDFDLVVIGQDVPDNY